MADCKTVLKVVLLTGCIAGFDAAHPGPTVIASKGAIWPRPQRLNTSDDYFVLKPDSFKFVLLNVNNSCSLLENALERYLKIVQDNAAIVERNTQYMRNEKFKKKWLNDATFQAYVDQLAINLTGQCSDDEYPNLNMDESYNLKVTTDAMELQASSVWGVLRGLETFSQLIYVGTDDVSLRLNVTLIDDFPRYTHRGLLIDTSRHFLPLDTIYANLDAMAFNKLNVLHWHIVDDESFPYVSEKFPELSQKGAYNPNTKVYRPKDVQKVIEYARQRGIRVLPEFDTPGHTSSWGVSHPELLTPCEVLLEIGPMDPSKNTTFSFLKELFTEVRDVFKDDYLHLGGDEVDFSCWQQSENITDFMDANGITTYEGLESYYVQKVVSMVDKLDYKTIVWEEVFTNHVVLPRETLVHVWKTGWEETLKKVTEEGNYGLLSACWYLDGISSGGDWIDFYYCDPSDFGGNEEQQKLVLGGEACMWGEVVNEYNVISRVWPRACATAEKLWSPFKDDYNIEDPERRLEEHTCRMNRRGIGAQPPNGPGYCD